MNAAATQPGVDAVDEDAPRDDEQTPTERPKSAREIAMEEVAESRRKAMNEEMVRGGADPLPGFEPADDNSQTNDQIARLLADDEGPVALEGDLSRYRIKTKIDGEESEISLEDALRQYQKNGAADRRLAEATRLFEEAKRISAQAAAPVSTDPAPNEPAAAAVNAAGFKQASSALFEGDEDKAAALFDQAVDTKLNAALERTGRAAGATPDLVATVMQSIRQQQVVESALAKSRSDYPDLYADPDIEQLAATKLTRLTSEGTPFDQALETVGGEFAKKFGWKEPGRSEAARPNRERTERLDRKAGIDNVPATNARRVSTDTTPEVTDESQRAAHGIAQIIAARPGMGR